MGPLEACRRRAGFPTARRLIIVGNEPGQPVRTYRAAFPNGPPQVLLPESLTAKGLRTSSGCLLATETTGVWRRFDAKGPGAPVAGLQRTDTLLTCAGDGRSADVSDNTVIPAVVYRVDLVTGQRRKIAELAPADRAGLLSVAVSDYRDNGQYVYGYVRGVSTLFVATPVK